jgi:uncharacterized protein (TIGR02145 family)
MSTNRAFLLLIAAFLPVFLQAQTQPPCGWNPDYDGDNTVGVSDLLALLGVFEEVDNDGDGIFDSQDDCVGVYDACGVCNGSCLPGPEQCGGVSEVIYHGHAYALVGVGNQCWFRENLRSDQYRNGDAIPGGFDAETWAAATFGAQAVYLGDDAQMALGGRFYNWYAVNDARGLCPAGFHVPTDGEWHVLESALGLAPEELLEWGFRGSGPGDALKATAGDLPAWDGTNASGFSAVPAGYRHYYGDYYDQTHRTFFWSSSPLSEEAIYRGLQSGQGGVERGSAYRQAGISIRCVKD